MGNSIMHSINNNFNNLFTKKLQIVMLGLDNSGKTTLLYRMKLKENIHETTPTTAFNVETIRPFKNLKFVVWDTAGHDDVRPLWRAYIRKSDAMIFVIDSSDLERFDEARVELDQILTSKDSYGIPLLILANKQDLDNSISTLELAKKLDLDSLKATVNWHMHPTSGRYGDGLQEALLQLSDMITKKRKKSGQWNKRTTSGGTNDSEKPRFERIEASKFV